MVELSDDDAKKKFTTYQYRPPSKERITQSALSPGVFSAKCRVCKQIISAHTIEELHKHKCQDK